MIRELIEGGNVGELLNVVIAVLIIGSTILAFGALIWAGLQFILSAGDEEKAAAAQGTIRSSVIGLFTVFIAFFIVRFLTGLFDIPFEMSYDAITATMTEIMSSLQ